MSASVQTRAHHPAVSWSPHVVGELRRRALEAALGEPRHCGEVGGLLLGSVSERAPYVVFVEEIHPLETGDPTHAGFVLTEDRHSQLAELLARTRSFGEHFVVGYYRSRSAHGARAELDQSDCETIARHFCDPSHIFLAIRPWSWRRCAATLYYWNEGALTPTGPTFELGQPEPYRVSALPSLPASAPRKRAFDGAWFGSLAFVVSMAGLLIADLPARTPCVIQPATVVESAPQAASAAPVLAPAPTPEARAEPELTRRATPREPIQPAISEAIVNRITAPLSVAVRVQVGADGRVVSAEPAGDYAEGLQRYLARQSAGAVRTARFLPALASDGASVASTETVSFVFSPRSASK